MKLRRVLIFLICACTINLMAQHKVSVPSKAGMQFLKEGNARFVQSKPQHKNQNKARLTETAKGQHPFAIIVSCSDSRVPPEILFDQGIGDLFIVRSAGNVVDDIGLASIEYAVEHLGVGLVVVLGHEKCGAVDATVKGAEVEGHIKKLVSYIVPAVDKARNKGGDLLENSILANVDNVVNQLKSSKPILEEFVTKKKLTIVGARYDLDNGAVNFLN